MNYSYTCLVGVHLNSRVPQSSQSSFEICQIYLAFARAMEQAPVSCLPTNAKMSKAKKVLEEAREIENPELDLFDKGVSTFEEMPGLRKCI